MKHTEFENLIFFFFEKTKEKPLNMYITSYNRKNYSKIFNFCTVTKYKI